MSEKKMDFRDASVPVYLQVNALSKISHCLQNDIQIDKGIDDLLNELKSYNNNIGIDFIKKIIFNTSTCLYCLYFFVCCVEERNLVERYKLDEESLCDVIKTKYDIKMKEFTRFLRNSIAHMNFNFYENGDIEIYNTPKVDNIKIILDEKSKIKDVFNFFNGKKLNDIKVKLNEEKKYELIEQKYGKELYKFTHEEFLAITSYYVDKFVKNIMTNED